MRLFIYRKVKLTFILSTLISLTFGHLLFGQCSGSCGPSLISNPSFELSTTNCDTMNSEIFTDYSQVQDWFGTACISCSGNGSTPDYYNSACPGAAGTENCSFGTASVGFFTSIDVGGGLGSNAREYVQTPLTSTLVAGQEYCATIHVKTSPASFAYVPSDGLGLFFTDQMIDIDVDNGGQQYLGPGSIVNATPQIANAPGNIIDTVCTTITGSFIATGNETWMIMGNFRPDNMMQTSATNCGSFFSTCFGYLIVDQVDVIPICSSCNATISAAGPFCENATATNLTAADPGGTWSGTGITDANNGTFDPSVAGVGTHQIIYDLTCGDADTIDIVVNALDDATFSYSATNYCLSDPNPTPSITGLGGGTFTIDNSGTINASTGEINLTSSGVGSYNITYTTTGLCPNSSSMATNIVNASDATITPAGPFCLNEPSINLTAVDAGGTWTGNGITDGINGTFDPATAGTGNHQIIYTITGSCGDADTISITINALDDPSFTYPQNNYCVSDADPTPTISGLSGGTFTISSPGDINATTGEINLTNSGSGTFTVTYTTNGTCPNNLDFIVSVSNAFDASINAVGPFCENDPIQILTAANSGGTWSGSGITNSSSGEFTPSTAGVGSHQIIYTISGSCGDADTINITVNAAEDATFTYNTFSYCLSDPNPIPTITGTGGGTFNIDNAGSINSSTGEIDLQSSGAGTFVITYTTSGSCPDTATFTVTIQDANIAIIISAGPFCVDEGIISLTGNPSGGTWSGSGITDTVNGTFDPSTAGIGDHIVYYSFGGNCSSIDSSTISVLETPSISLPPTYTISYGDNVVLNPTYNGSGTFAWTPSSNLSCDDCDAPLASPTVTTVYCVDLSNGACSDTACTQVIVDYNCGEVALPSAFSPGSGDVNAFECVLGNCVVNMHLKIYNRWGELVFESFDQNTCWDGTHQRNGKELNTGVFVYQLTADLIDGTSINQKGNITLLR